MTTVTPGPGRPSTVADKGLKKDALGFVSSVVIGVASTAPGYSLAASLGLVVAVSGIGLQAPAVLLVAFVPMLLIASAYYYMNRADPDCGTTFSWATRASGPAAGWRGGWAIVVADVIVMANLAQIAGLYSFLLVGWQSAADSTFAVTAVGVVWIAIMTTICVIGIELSARTQVGLLGAEIITLVLFSVVALIKVATGDAGPDSVDPSLSWLNPFAIDSTSALISGVLIAVFIYWGWDSTVPVNEESKDSTEGPGKAALLATVILLAIYIIVAYAAQSYGGVQQLIDNQDDVLSVLGTQVFGSPLDKILIIAVLTSAAASTQTTILPTARTTLSMARWGAIPATFGTVSPRYQTPTVSTIVMGVTSIVWFVGVNLVSQNVLGDSVTAIGFMIAFYYGLTGLACVIYYRRAIASSARNFLLAGVLPFAGFVMLAYVFVRAYIDYGTKGYAEDFNYTPPLLGVEVPIIIGIGGLLAGVGLMLWAMGAHHAFFRRRLEVADPRALDEPEIAAAGVDTIAPEAGV